MDQGRVSVSYARALLEWTSSNNLSGEVYAQSKQFYLFMNQSPEFGQLLSSPAVSIGRKQQVIESLVAEFAPQLSRLITVVLKKRRENQLPYILLMFQKLYRAKFGIARVQIESSTELTSDSVKGIVSFLKSKLGKEIEIEQKVNPALIGGFTLTIDDLFMDRSVKGELELFSKKLLGIV